MFLLIAEAAGFHKSFSSLAEGTAISDIAHQLHHHRCDLHAIGHFILIDTR